MKKSRLLAICLAAGLFTSAMLATPSAARSCWCVGPWTTYASATGNTCTGAVNNLAVKLSGQAAASCDPYGTCSEDNFTYGSCYIANNRITVDGSLTFTCVTCFPEGN